MCALPRNSAREYERRSWRDCESYQPSTRASNSREAAPWGRRGQCRPLAPAAERRERTVDQPLLSFDGSRTSSTFARPRPQARRPAAQSPAQVRYTMARDNGSAAVTRASPRKQEAVAKLTEQLSRATSVVVTDYRGLSVTQLEDVRKRLRAAGVDYVVVKNTLARRAANAAGVELFAPALTGPVGLAVGYGELSAPARILNEYFR